ncbi:5' DNA nuclease [Neorhizobium huautlense]|uniref:5' DNA nuclease n=1 Tax=Neorhizobium huautlense TaxID=67774 RepID=UPI000CF9ED0D|nr:5' DNA nuclease [Neorhizobium huautlense]
MAKKSDERKIGTADDPTVDRARAPDFSEALSLNPLFAHSAAAMAAATAIGFGFANQMASAFFGALQGALETAGQKSTEKQAEASTTVEAPEAPASAPGLAVDAPSVAKTSGVAPEKPKAKPARKPAAQKKTAAKPVQPEAPVVKAKAEASTVAKAKKAVTGKPAAVSGADDLKRISGIGPKLEAVLKGLGVKSVSQIAAWKDADITRFDKELGFEGRIKRDDWVGQAKALLK